MKGVILGINPDVRFIDITHNISPQNIFEASQVIAMSYKYFPSSTIHIAVVDPEVGGDRRPLLIATKNYSFIGPDNGIFTPIFEEMRLEYMRVIHITASHNFLPMSGYTFHGRDIFAPVAAWLSKGIDCSRFGEQITDYVKIPLNVSRFEDEGVINGNVISIDNFGNAITNITKGDLAKLSSEASSDRLRVIYKENRISMVGYYADPGISGEALSALINSFGHLELFVYKHKASSRFNIEIGDSVSARLV
jgi:S-adenosylmethionine hydrolase